MSSNKKGQTLIEVVVALAILAIVFSGTVTLIVNVVTLNLSAREKTRAVALAQAGLAEGIQALGENCTTTTLPVIPPSGTNPKKEVSFRRVSISKTGSLVTGSYFIKVTSKVTWTNRLGSHEYSVSEIVRNQR